MKRTKFRNALFAAGLAGATLVAAAPATAQMDGAGMGPGMMRDPAYEQRQDRAAPPESERGPRRGYGMGPGMMGGMGPGMMGGYGMGPGMMGGMMGPGMMGGYGMGPGMMGGMMGPGMMGGYGMGPGMMGSYGMGPGMMGGMMGPGMMGGYGTGCGGLEGLNLSPEQRKTIEGIHQELAKKNWETTGKLREEAFKLHNLTAADRRDRAAIINQYKKLQDLRLQNFQARLDAHDKVEGVFTKEQKDELRRFGPRW